jgi:uncharacterized OsmC-like protein
VDDRYLVVVGAGTLRSTDAQAVAFPHRWTTEGVTVEGAFTGAHLLHLAVAGCVLNDIYRVAADRRMEVTGVRVAASGQFDPTTWQSAGIDYSVEVQSSAPSDDVARLIELVDVVAEIPRAVRSGAPVRRVPAE